MTELASVHRLTRASLKKQRAGAGFKAIKLKLGFDFDEDFRLRRSIRQAVSETVGRR
jgi:L-alanine-DL-glutamate epimerase-like enolase superfamily enzyme